MRRIWGILVLCTVSLVAALVTGRDLYFHLTYLTALAGVLSAVWAVLALRGLRLIRRTTVRRTQVGQPFEEQFTLYNDSCLPKLWVVVQDESELPGHYASRVIHNLGPHQQQTWIVRTVCERRGCFRLGPLTISAGDPLGLFELRRHFAQTSQIIVCPATFPLRRFPLPYADLSGGGIARRRTHYITPHAAGVREYVPGDSFNRIHWPSTARLGRLIAKEFEFDPQHELWIFLDMQKEVHVRETSDEWECMLKPPRQLWKWLKDMPVEPSTEEYTVTAAACVAEYFLKRKWAVGLVAHGQHREAVPADRGERQLSRLLETLAALRAEGDQPFHEVLAFETRWLTSGAFIVAISPSPCPDWIEMATLLDCNGLRVMGIVVDRTTFGGISGGFPPTRPRITRVPTVTLRKGDSIAHALSAPLPGFRTQRPSPPLQLPPYDAPRTG